MSDRPANQENPDTETEDRTVERVARPQGTPLVYTNNVYIKASIWDFTMEFGTVKDVAKDKVFIQDEVTLVMSPQHAIAFAEILSDNIRKYESQFGPIPRSIQSPDEN